MTRKRKVKPESLSVQKHLQHFKDRVRTVGRIFPAGVEQDELRLKAPGTDAATNIDRWISSSGLRSPT